MGRVRRWRQGGEDEGELAAAEQGEGQVGGGDPAGVLQPGNGQSRGQVQGDGEGDADEDRCGDGAGVAGVDAESEGEEEGGGESVAQWQDEAFDAFGRRGLGEDEADTVGADGFGHAELGGDAGDEHGEADEAQGEQFVVEPSTGLDVATQTLLAGLLGQLRDEDHGLLMTTHDLRTATSL